MNRTNAEVKDLFLGKTVVAVYLNSDSWDNGSCTIGFKFNDGTKILLSAYEGRNIGLETPDDGISSYEEFFGRLEDKVSIA